MANESEINPAQEMTSAPGDRGDLPTEAFACPNCGQMLAPSCRVCVACHEPIDFTKLKAPVILPLPVAPAEKPEAEESLTARAHFSWPIFFVVLGAYLGVAFLARAYLNTLHFKIFLSSVLVASSVWVIYDAHSKKIPHPFRWGVGSILLWIIVFPWYLSRRRTPEASCPLMEGKGSVFIRALIWIVLILFVLSLLEALFVHKPPH